MTSSNRVVVGISVVVVSLPSIGRMGRGTSGGGSNIGGIGIP